MGLFSRPPQHSKEFLQQIEKINEGYRQYFRDRIKEARTERHFTQEQLGNAIHKSGVIISDLERGRTEISAVDLISIAAVLEKPIKFFFPIANVPSEEELNTEEWEIVLQYRKLENHPDLKSYLMDEAKKLAEVAKVKEGNIGIKLMEDWLSEAEKKRDSNPIETKQLRQMLKDAKKRMGKK